MVDVGMLGVGVGVGVDIGGPLGDICSPFGGAV